MNFKQLRETAYNTNFNLDAFFGFEQGTLDRLESGRENIDTQQLKAIRAKCPFLSTDWLLDEAFKQPKGAAKKPSRELAGV